MVCRIGETSPISVPLEQRRIHANQIVGPAAESVPCGNERWLLIDGPDRCMPNPYRQKAGLRKPAAPQQPCQYRNDERNRNKHLFSPFSWGAW
jgi:hypothetical protein